MLQRLASFFNVSVDELLNGPAQNEIRVEIVIRKSDEPEEKEEMDLSKDAPYIETITLAPDKIGLKLTFSKEKPLREICEAILLDEEKFENARKALYE
jgi:hypothetical protein